MPPMHQEHWYYVNSAALQGKVEAAFHSFNEETMHFFIWQVKKSPSQTTHTLTQKINGKSLRQMAIQDKHR